MELGTRTTPRRPFRIFTIFTHCRTRRADNDLDLEVIKSADSVTMCHRVILFNAHRTSFVQWLKYETSMESLVNFFSGVYVLRWWLRIFNKNRGCLKNHNTSGKGIILCGRNTSIIENRIESMRPLVLDKIKLENLFGTCDIDQLHGTNNYLFLLNRCIFFNFFTAPWSPGVLLHKCN